MALNTNHWHCNGYSLVRRVTLGIILYPYMNLLASESFIAINVLFLLEKLVKNQFNHITYLVYSKTSNIIKHIGWCYFIRCSNHIGSILPVAWYEWCLFCCEAQNINCLWQTGRHLTASWNQTCSNDICCTGTANISYY